MNILSNHNRLLRGAPIPTAGGDVYNSGWEYTPEGEISGYSGSAIYTGEECPCDSAAIVDSAFNKSTAWVDEQNYLTAHQDITNLPYIQNSALESSPQGLISGISGSGLYATSAEGAFSADTAYFAYNAEYADSAQTANFATYSLSSNRSDIANYAVSAGIIANGWEYDETSAITAYNGSAFAGDNTPYSAGANIDITNHVVSGKDWTTEIQNASSYAVDQATAQIPAVTGLPYVENSALDYTPGGHLVSGISGDALYAISAEGAFTAETAKYANVAESANYVEGGWEYDGSNNITGYSGSAFAATGAGKVYDGIDPIVVNNVEDKISANIIGLSAGNGIDITEIANKVVISCTGAGGNTYTGISPIVVDNEEAKISADCIELSAGQGIDSASLSVGIIACEGAPYTLEYSSPATSYSSTNGLSIVENVVQQVGTYRRLYSGSHIIGELVPNGYNSNQYLTTNSNGTLQWVDIPSKKTVECIALTTSVSSFDLSALPDNILRVTITTPYAYNTEGGHDLYPIYLNGTYKTSVVSGGYKTIIKQNNEYGESRWFEENSGAYYVLT